MAAHGDPKAVAGFLGGLRVVELAGMVAGPYCTKLLADLGADVVKVEPPGGDPSRAIGPFVGGGAGPERSVLFLHLNTSKRGVVHDIATPDGASGVRALVAEADLFVTDVPDATLRAAGLDPADLLAANPSLVVLALSPYGASGPYADHAADPFTLVHAGGDGYLTPVASHHMPEVVDRPPLRQGRFAAEYKLATYATAIALGAVFHARATGQGQAVELSKQDALIGLNFFEFAQYLAGQGAPTRASLAVPFGGIQRCKDGYLQFTMHEEHQWRSLVKAMGDPAWAQEPWAASLVTRFQNAQTINAHLEEWLSTRTRSEVVHEGQANGVTVAPYLSIDEVAASDQMAHRGFFREVAHPVAGSHRYPTGAWSFSGDRGAPGPAPLLGEHQGAVFAAPRRPNAHAGAAPGRGALAGVRVLDFTWAVAGPTGTMVLAALGAEVIKVESSLRLDVLRRGTFNGATTNRDKKSIALNLRHPKAVELARQLVAVSDVVAESFRPGVLDALGLGYDEVRRIKPDVIMLSSSMAGQTGPFARFAGYAPMFVALSGLGEMTGYADGPPTQIRAGGDVIVGVHNAFALTAALLHHQATGEGAHIDLSSIEAQACLVGDSLLDYLVNGTVQRRTGNDEPDVAPHNCYRCAGDDQWVAIAARTDEQWRALTGAIGAPEWASDPRFAHGADRAARRAEIDGRIAAWTATRTPHEVTAVLQAVHVPSSPSFRAQELFTDPHVVSRDLVARRPGMGGEDFDLVRMAGRLPASPLRLERAGADLGEHTREVLGSLLGLSSSDLDALADDGVLT